MRCTSLFIAVAAAESITFMFPFYASIWSAGIQTVTDSTTVYNAQCDNQGEFGPCQEGIIYTYTILDDRRFAYTATASVATPDFETFDGARTSRMVSFYDSVNASCSITSDGAQCVSTSVRAVVTEGEAGITTTTSTSGYRGFVEFVIDVPSTGTAAGHVTAVTSPVIGANTPRVTPPPQTTTNPSGLLSSPTSSAATNGTNLATTQSSANRVLDWGNVAAVLISCWYLVSVL